MQPFDDPEPRAVESEGGASPRSPGPGLDVTRRAFIEGTGAIGGALALAPLAPVAARAQPNPQGGAPGPVPTPTTMPVTLKINGAPHPLAVDTRTTLLDALRERLHLTGSKKGCDHGQCGACTVLVNGVRINACLTLAVMHEGDEIVTIEGLARGDELHPVQAAFVEHDGFQCGYCTPGQIVSAVGMLDEVRAGRPSHATADLLAPVSLSSLTDDEIRERMSGNLCRCGAHAGIVAAIKDAAA